MPVDPRGDPGFMEGARQREAVAMPWVIDKPHSYVGFKVQHMMFTTVRGHFGEYTGTIDINPHDLTQSHFEGDIQVASIDTRVPMRDDDLRSERFFDVAHHPTIHYRSTQIEALGGNRFRVRGLITIRGVTREVVVQGNYAGGPYRDPDQVLRTGFSATGTLNRRDFGLVWNVALEAGGVLVGETITLQLDIELKWEEAPAGAAAQTAGPSG